MYEVQITMIGILWNSIGFEFFFFRFLLSANSIYRDLLQNEKIAIFSDRYFNLPYSIGKETTYWYINTF